eukprot:TRINITY_DN3698_c0_g1_i4.p1 TRINITY_DN3698_c0_g1~~TRINITY_DN3698_c0_g1_i4.p1  ORF type:complete len:108 (-),score=9.33 TRINITY_DN3698_c0_g1_i4:146-469(-)
MTQIASTLPWNYCKLVMVGRNAKRQQVDEYAYTKSCSSLCKPLGIALNSILPRSRSFGCCHSIIFPPFVSNRATKTHRIRSFSHPSYEISTANNFENAKAFFVSIDK